MTFHEHDLERHSAEDHCSGWEGVRMGGQQGFCSDFAAGLEEAGVP